MTNEKDFSCVGGLAKHIQILKEMVLFPLMYGDLYSKFNLKPPRGLLFYGPPGTGKTFVASALATECSNSDRKVSFISRKGSDCLSKWVGESEKKLQQIFQSAHQSKPCIIFFDEIDGLAPVRSAHQDYVHASVVSTLLALMDGLDNNSEVIVVGSTNRLDAIDPALRRPGRFDRELYFPLPCYKARREILSIQMAGWRQKPSVKFLAYLAAKTIGFSGSDLQAFCAEAVMCSIRKAYPQIYTSKIKYQISEKSLKIEKLDFLDARKNIIPASHRVAITPVKDLSTKIQPLLQQPFETAMSKLKNLCPPDMLTSDAITGKASSRSPNCPRLLLCGKEDSHTRHLGPAVLHALEHLPCHVLDITTLFEVTGRGAEEAIIQRVKEARRTLPSILYVPDILAWWNLVEEPARVVLECLMRGLDSSVPMLILTTATCATNDLPSEIRSMYNEYHDEIFEVKSPGATECQDFFEQLYHQVGTTPVDPAQTSSNTSVEILHPKRTRRGTIPNVVQSSNSTCATNLGSVTEIASPRKLRATRKCRRKMVKTVPSMQATTAAARKRDHKVTVEGPPSKRQKSAGSDNMEHRNNAQLKKLTDGQIKELLEKTVYITQEFTTRELEELFSILEGCIEKHDDDIFPRLEKCLSSFQASEKSKMNLKMQT